MSHQLDMIAEPTPCSSWRFDTTDLTGFSSTSEHPFRRELGSVGFGNCSVSGSLIAVGANRTSSNHLVLIDFSLLESRKPSVRSSVQNAEEINYTKWITGETIACATGSGRVQIFRVSDRATAPSLAELCSIRDLHSDGIRELVIHPIRTGLLAAGGYDRSITITDLSKITLHHRITYTDVISSIKWRKFLNGAVLSATADCGAAIFYDLRQNPIMATTQISSGKSELFVHERIDNYGVLLGYGDGEMRFYDMRNPLNALASVVDPIVKCIGSIEMNDDSQTFVASGKEGVSLWKIVKGNGCQHNGYIAIDGALTSATFSSKTQIIVSTSLPSISWASFS